MKSSLTKLSLIVAIGFSATSCDYQKYNSIRQADVREDDKYIYGVHKDSAAVQLKNKYTPRPELDGRTQKIREKLFGTGTIGEGA